LQQALIELIGEQGYEAITIQEIVDRANVGRTTFYLHYTSKDIYSCTATTPLLAGSIASTLFREKNCCQKRQWG
jgi:AcrR family transcriptional regulator